MARVVSRTLNNGTIEIPKEASSSPRQVKRTNYIQSSLKASSRAILESEKS